MRLVCAEEKESVERKKMMAAQKRAGHQARSFGLREEAKMLAGWGLRPGSREAIRGLVSSSIVNEGGQKKEPGSQECVVPTQVSDQSQGRVEVHGGVQEPRWLAAFHAIAALEDKGREAAVR